MRDYNEVTQSILRRRDEQIAKDKRRAMIVKTCAAAAALVCCTAVVLGTGMFRSGRNSAILSDISEVTPAVTTSGSVNESVTTAYDSEDTSKITTALSEASAETTRKRATAITTSSVKADAICTVTNGNAISVTVSQNNAVTSSKRADTAAVTTTAADAQQSVPVHEVRIDMQRIPAFLSALTASMSNVISNVNTEYHVNTDRYPNQKNGIENIRRQGLVTDLDMDGKFDLTDCLAHYLYCRSSGDSAASDEINSRIAKNADYNADGEISLEDTNILICYYLINNRISYDDVNPVTYDPSFSGSINQPVSSDGSKASFAGMVNDIAHNLLIDQYIIEDMVDKDIIDLDVNEDGTVDIADYAYLKINGDNYLDNYIVPVDGGYTTAPRPNAIVLPDNIRKNCDAVYYARPFVCYEEQYEVSSFVSGLEGYFAMHMTLMPEYYENDFYESMIEYAGEYSIGDSLYCKAVEIGIIPDDDSYFHFDNDVFENGFKAYYENVLSGKQPAPDLNMDGAVDHKDYDLANDYIFEVAAHSDNNTLKMPADVWNNINSRCDFNQNGTSGDIYDIFFAQIYVLLTEDEVPHDDPDCSGSYNYSDEPYVVEPSGDVNGDGIIDMADAVMIMQYLSNPSKYQLSDKGRFNGDIEKTGNGITINDVMAIQNHLLNLNPHYTE